MKVLVKLPSLLLHCSGGRGEVELEAADLEELFAVLLQTYPALKGHLFDDSGKRREHVLFFFNDENVDWLENPSPVLKQGDRLTILQAVSGG